MTTAILTFAVGADYKKAMEPGMASKRAYAARHGYTFLEGGEDVWDRKRPIPWSKINFILKHIDEYDYVFWSDGDVIITNPDRTLEDLLISRLPPEKDMLWCRDACGNLNNGNVLFRGKSAWVRDFLRRCYEQTDLLHHIWWDNAAFIRVLEKTPADQWKVETCEDPALFNAYLFDRENRTEATGESRLYRPGDFLVHFAGIYDILNIHRFMMYVDRCAQQGKAPNPHLLTLWRENPPMNRGQAEVDGLTAPVPE